LKPSVKNSGIQVGRQHLHDLMDHVLRHRQGALADVDDHKQFAFRVHGRPHPVRGALQALDGFGLAEFIVFDGTEDGVQLVQLQLAYVDVTQKILRKGLKLLGGFHQPLQHGVGVHLKHPGGGTNAQAFSQAGEHAYDQLN
jgi:hypothetical protein